MNTQHFATQSHFAARTGSGGLSQQFATVGHSQPPPPLHTWTPPSPAERQHFDALFALADEEQRGAIGGQQAVAFFSRSHADKQVLREIWGLADTQRKGELSRSEFYVAMRLIAMTQRGEPVSLQRFLELAAAPFPLPSLDGVPPPMPQMQHQQQQQYAPTGTTTGSFGSAPQAAAGGTGMPRGSYAITDMEKTRYDAIFAQHDADGDGFLLGGEAVNLFQMSGLDRNALREIWALADRGQDSKLDVKEFYVAMHLIVCASKRGLPVPPQLPQELVESAFGTPRGSFTTAPQSEFAGAAGVNGGAPNSRSGSMQTGGFGGAHEQQSADSGDDPFAGLNPAADTTAPVPPRMGSFTSSEPQPTPAPEHRSSFQQQQQQTPPGSARGSLYGVSTPMPSVQDPAAHVGGFNRTNSSSMSSFSGGHAMPSSYGSPGAMMHHAPGAGVPGPQGPNGMMMGGYGMPPAPALPQQQHMMTSKPFLSDEEDQQAVRQLDEQNEQVAKCLEGVEKTQSEIETLAEKLLELDQLRHELVTLAMKRESVRAANSAASSSSSASASDRLAQQQTKLAVERSLQDLIESEKRSVETLQQELSGLEIELQREGSSSSGGSKSSSFASMSLSSAPTPAATASQSTSDFAFASLGVVKASSVSSTSSAAPLSNSSFSAQSFASAGFDSFGDFSAAKSSAASTPAAATTTTSFDFATPSPANSTSSGSGAAFDGFGDFASSKPAAAPSPATAPTTASSTPNGFDAFANFSFN